ncbi:MAG: MerR family transcriptional regulator [Scytonema sp. PMC 1069.18]|nr:MerR family transcriptional regulator [Scytonema sp. PMC 1069.18]
MQTELQIGQVANLLGITPKTIRHYHKLGILPPPKRAENGYRIYSVQSLYRINLIKSLKKIGFSLQDIKVIVDAENPDDALRFKLDEVLKTTQTQVAELQARQTAIEHLISTEATLDETRQTEFHVISMIIPDSIPQFLKQVAPEFWILETSLYEQIDKFNWGAEYKQFLKELFQFLESNPEFIQNLHNAFEKASLMDVDDGELEFLAEDLAESLFGTSLLTLFEDSAFSQDKRLFQTFLLVAQDQIEDGISVGQKQLLRLLEKILKNAL